MRRLVTQIATLLVLSSLLGLSTNALRSQGLDLGGRDPERFRHPDVEFIGAEDAALLLEDIQTLFLDARPPGDFERRRVFGAVSFPADDQEKAYEELRDFLTPEMQLVVYSGNSMRSVRLVRFLAERGFTARVLEGGWDAWQERHLPVE
jgi:rhodanese-related sulfurtransferase